MEQLGRLAGGKTGDASPPPLKMPTDAKVRALLTSPGSNSPFEIARVNVRGFEVNAWKHANPSMRQLWLSSEANGAKPYLIYIDNELPLNGIDDPRIVKAPMLTYADTHFQSRSLAHYLISLGLKRGDRVAIAGRNCFEWIVAFWTIVSLGLIAVPINAWLKAEQMEYCLDMTEPRVIICDGERMQTFVEHGTFGRLGKKGLEKIVSMFPGRFLDNLDARGNEAWKQLKSSSTYTTFDSVLASGASIAKRNGDKFPDPLGPVPENHPFGNSLDIHPEEGATIFFSR